MINSLASFVWAVERSDSLGQWIRNRTLELVRLSLDEWIGPWYRKRGGPEPVGALETSHIALAVCEAYENCSELFTDEELEEIRTAIRDKGMILCKRFCKEVVNARNHINNWFIVLLNGYGTCALVLDDKKEIEQAIKWAHLASRLYNSNDYGESLQYSNYSNIHFTHFNEIAIRKGINPEELEIECYTRLMPWYASSFIHMKYIDSLDTLAPRAFNFGDSGAIFRPSGDVLAHVSARMKDKYPREAGLARWLLENTHPEVKGEAGEAVTFGCFNHQFHYHTILLYDKMADALTPEEAGLPKLLSFAAGQIICRDRWNEPRTVVALQAGYKACNVDSHRHLDQNSFQVVIGKERMLVDPGHCCYRLMSQAKSADETSHSTISIFKDNNLIRQKKVQGNIFDGYSIGNKLLYNRSYDDTHVIASDMAGLYDSFIRNAIRIWVMKLPNCMFVIDFVEADEPIQLACRFVANNKDNKLKVDIMDNHRILLRRGGEALKLYSLYSLTDGNITNTSLEFDWTYVHDFYHPLPNRAGQGKGGSGLTYVWRGLGKGKQQLLVHALMMESEDDIHGWDAMVEDGVFQIISSNGKGSLKVKFDENENIQIYGNNGLVYQIQIK